MKNVTFSILLILVVTLLPHALVAQRVENLRATFAGDKVTILYDLTDAKDGQTFSIQLFGSHNSYATALRLVSGDVGEAVKSGRNKTIIWDAGGELTKHNGAITFRIQGSLILQKLAILSPTLSTKVRRGKNATISWEGSDPNQNVKMDLYKGGNLITSVGNSKNNGSYTWAVPKKLEKGRYEIKLATGQETVTSDLFTIQPKIGMALKIIPGVVVAGVAVLLLTNKSSSDDKLPAPPDPE